MSTYDKETKFYWLQLKEDFFEDDAIEWLEEQEPNGRDYAYFYLKLCLKSLKTNGILIRSVGNILIPYDNKKLAELTKMDFDTVTVAMELLKQIGLVQILENGEIYITQLENLIGSVSKGALKKQQQRLLNGQKVDKCPPKIEYKVKDKTKDKDIYILFDEFWNAYPKKRDKGRVEKWFTQHKPTKETVELMIKQIERLKDTKSWKENNGQYIPYPSTWLNAKGWEDEFETDSEREERIDREIMEGTYGT